MDKTNLNLNIINFNKVNKGEGGGKVLINQKWIIYLFLETFPNKNNTITFTKHGIIYSSFLLNQFNNKG